MKTLVKWKWSMVLSILFVLAMAIYITVGSKGEEKSKLGYTVNGRAGTATHIDACDINVVTPKSYLRFFPDSARREIAFEMKKLELCFLALSDDYHYFMEFYILPASEFGSSADYERRIAESQGEYDEISELNGEDLTIGGVEYHKVCYKRKDIEYHDYGVVTDYFTEYNGNVLEVRCYFDMSQETELRSGVAELDKIFVPCFEKLSYGEMKKNDTEGNYLWERWKSLTFAPWVLIVPFVYLFLCGITFMGFSERVYNGKTGKYYYVSDEGTGWNEDFLSRDTSKMLLGFCAVMVVFHHLTQQVGTMDAGLIGFLANFGVGFVGVFFFFSGFGLYESVQKKEDYLKGFLKKRLPTVLVPFYSAILIFVLTEIVTDGIGRPKDIILWLTGLKLINSQMWYMIEIILLYLLFFVLFRLIKNRSLALFALFMCCVAMVAGSLLLGHGENWFQGEWWYNTTLLFPFGVWFSKHKEGLTEFLKHYYGVCLVAVAFLFCLYCKLTGYMLSTYGYWSETGADKGYDDKFRCLSVQCPMVLCFVLLLLILGMKLRIGNGFLRFLGSISLELYLIHNLFIGGFSMIKGAGALMFSVVVASIAAATVLHYLNTCIFCLIYKRPFPRYDIGKKLRAYRKKRSEEWAAFKFQKKMELAYARKHKKRTAVTCLRHAVCIILCALSLFPICILLINATKTSHGILQGLSFLPGGNFAENYMAAKGEFSSGGNTFFKVVGRSVLIAGGCTLIGTYIGALCAYGFEFYKFGKKKVLWNMVICSLMIPQIAGAVGFLRMVLKLHMYNGLLPLILVGIAIPSCAYFFRMYLHSMQLKDIIEAARIDGCKEYMIFNRVILPIMKPAVFLELIFNFAVSWNNTVYQNLVLTDIKKKTISIFLINATGGRGSGSDPVVYCMLLLSTVPSLIVYILFSPGIMARINIGSIKE
ncbi:MAG: acyltransferase family protein [Lachnospiraceae bacterium]|nr:acyltransferase family protein [Lachnospiraceae bacterium]